MDFFNLPPADIEKESFKIIEKELGNVSIADDLAPIIKRVIHTTADFDYVKNLYFSPGCVDLALDAIKNGALIVSDTQMVKAGINKKSLAKHKSEVFCFISDDDVATQAKAQGKTRASISMEKALSLNKPLIFAIGNAPTALITLNELISEGKISPQLIIGVPVGFVNVAKSKDLIIKSNVTSIVSRGRKGGSNVAAAIVNALLYMLDGER